MTVIVDPYMEQQYNNRAAVPEHMDYLNSWKQRSELFRGSATAHLDVSYGSNSRQRLDVFPLEKISKAAVHVFIHGGYWQALDKDSFSFMAETFNRKGECAVILNYGLCPALTLSDIVSQLKQAMLWIQQNIENYGGNPGQVQMTGHSAGAHLLAMMLTTDWSTFGLNHYPFQQLNAISGLYDLKPLLATTVNQALNLDQKNAVQNSPVSGELWKPCKEIKLNLLVGELESDEYKKQSSDLADCWREQLSVQSIEVRQAHHFSILDEFLSR